jgi:hypothetical protein
LRTRGLSPPNFANLAAFLAFSSFAFAERSLIALTQEPLPTQPTGRSAREEASDVGGLDLGDSDEKEGEVGEDGEQHLGDSEPQKTRNGSKPRKIV